MKRYSLFLTALIILCSCHDDSDEVVTIIEKPDPPSILITTRLVSVMDPTVIEANHPEQTFAGQTASFDLLPFAQVKGSGINRDYELLRLTTQSNLPFLKVQSLVENDVNYTHLSIPAITTFSGQTSDDATYAISPNATLHIPSNSLTYTDGASFQGTYKVSLASMNPANNSAIDIPTYTGITGSKEEVSLFFDACYYVVFTSSDGTELKTNGATYISLPATTVNKGWVFNDEKGIWNTLGSTNETDPTKISIQGSGYYASAVEKPMTRVNGTLSINGKLTPHYPIRITYANQQRLIYSTNNGAWALQLPSSTECTAHVILPCGEEQQFLLTTTSATEMESTIQLTSDGVDNALIVGNTRDCNLNPVHNTITVLQGERESLIFSPDPDINFHIPICKNGTISITSIAMADGQSGPSITWKAADTIDIYTSFACEMARNEYLSLFVSGEKKMYWNLKSSVLPGNKLLIANDDSDPELEFEVFVEGLEEGVYQDNMLNILFKDMHLGIKGYSLYCPTATSGCGFTSFTITHFPQASGQWIRGHFEGTFWIKTFNPLTAGYRPVEGEFQVYRDF